MEAITDNIFGRLEFNREVKEYQGILATSQGAVTLSLHPDGKSLERTLEVARGFVPKAEDLIRAALDRLVMDMLPLKNRSWLNEDESQVTEDDFRQRVRLEAVTLYGGGLKTFGFGDDEMFGGHWLVVNIGEDDVPWKAELFG